MSALEDESLAPSKKSAGPVIEPGGYGQSSIETRHLRCPDEMTQPAIRPLTAAQTTRKRPVPPPLLATDLGMLEVIGLARRLSNVETSVLIQGETGVGKDAIAELIHRSGPRAKKPFVRLNCAALPQTLLESELFGSVRGAFTGAERDRTGYIEAAHGGTLYLDEIGELPLGAQVRLLNVLESREVRRLGLTEARRVDIRVISATHRNLNEAIRRRTFREDLYYRLSGFSLFVPPLRERPRDIALLVTEFVRSCAERDGRPASPVDASTLDVLMTHTWPGNVRQLKNAVEHAVVLAYGDRILPEHFPASVLP